MNLRDCHLSEGYTPLYSCFSLKLGQHDYMKGCVLILGRHEYIEGKQLVDNLFEADMKNLLERMT